ncbi:MAG: putative inorganic carbon transporter subunit DabA, partial [Chryseotalea sp.]
MNSKSLGFNEAHVLHELKHYLPAQAPLKDFIHHNTLHAFQHEPFKLAIRKAFKTFGYNTTLSLAAYRNLYASGNIAEATLRKGIANQKGENEIEIWMKKVIHTDYPSPGLPRIGALRAFWKKQYQLDMDSLVHPTLFRVLCSYLDQGIAMWNFPVWKKGFLESIKEIELN